MAHVECSERWKRQMFRPNEFRISNVCVCAMGMPRSTPTHHIVSAREPRRVAKAVQDGESDDAGFFGN